MDGKRAPPRVGGGKSLSGRRNAEPRKAIIVEINGVRYHARLLDRSVAQLAADGGWSTRLSLALDHVVLEEESL